MSRRALRSEHGYSMAELIVVVAIIGIMAFIAVPFMLSYIPGATVNYAATELQSGLNRAKFLAVSTRQQVCVQPAAGGYQFLTGGCAGAVWLGTGTSSTGVFGVSNNVTVALSAGLNPIFNQFGVAAQTGTFTVTGATGLQQTVTVQASGAVTIP
jgi:prepilin-type N-terminal cleavage/methylation domain-containing protein